MESFSYSNPVRLSYSFGLYAFTAAITSLVKPPPRVNQGRVVDIHTRVTITFNQVTTPAFVNIGISGTDTKYASLNMGAAAAGAAYNFRDTGGATNYNEAAAVISSDINFARDGVTTTQIKVVPMTGGTPQGTGYLDVSFAWF